MDGVTLAGLLVVAGFFSFCGWMTYNVVKDEKSERVIGGWFGGSS